MKIRDLIELLKTRDPELRVLMLVGGDVEDDGTFYELDASEEAHGSAMTEDGRALVLFVSSYAGSVRPLTNAEKHPEQWIQDPDEPEGVLRFVGKQ